MIYGYEIYGYVCPYRVACTASLRGPLPRGRLPAGPAGGRLPGEGRSPQGRMRIACGSARALMGCRGSGGGIAIL